MKKAVMVTVLSAAILAAVLLVGLPDKRMTDRPRPAAASRISSNFTSIVPSSQESGEVITTTSANSAGENTVYTVKEYKGHIGVFRGREKSPFKEIPVDVRVFPPIDQNLLKQGIKAYGPEELNRVIEDYTG